MVNFCSSCGKEIENGESMCQECKNKMEVREENDEFIDHLMNAKSLLDEDDDIDDLDEEPEEILEITEPPEIDSISFGNNLRSEKLRTPTDQDNIDVESYVPITGENGFGILELKDDIVRLTQRDDLEINIAKQDFQIENWNTHGKILITNPTVKKFIPLLSLNFNSMESIGRQDCYQRDAVDKTARLNIGYLLVPGHSFVKFIDEEASNGVIPLITTDNFNEIEKNIEDSIKPLEINYTFEYQKLIDMVQNSSQAPEVANLLFTLDNEFKWKIPISIKVLLAESIKNIETQYSKARREFILRLSEISARIEETISSGKIRHWDKKLNFEVYEKNYYKQVRPVMDEWLYKKQEFLYNMEKLADFYSIFITLENRSSQHIWSKDFNFSSVSILFPSHIQSINPEAISSFIIDTTDGTYSSQSEVYDPIENRLSWSDFSLISNPQETGEEFRGECMVSKLKPSIINLCFQINKNLLSNINKFNLELRGTYATDSGTHIINEVYFVSPMGFPISDSKKGLDFKNWTVPTKKGDESCGTLLVDKPVPEAHKIKSAVNYGFHFEYKIELEKLTAELLEFSKEELELTGIHCDDAYEILRDVLIKQGAKITWEQRPLELIHSEVIGLKEFFGEILVIFELQDIGTSYFDIEIRGEGKRTSITGFQDYKKQRSKVVFRIRSKKEAQTQIQQIINIIRERLNNFIKTKLKSISEEY